MDILEKLNIKEWYKFLTVVGAIFYVVSQEYVWVGIILFGLGEWSAWKEYTTIFERGFRDYTAHGWERRDRYKFHSISLRVIGISMCVLYFFYEFKLYLIF